MKIHRHFINKDLETIARDPRLTWRDKGVLLTIFTLPAKEFMGMMDYFKVSKDGFHVLETALVELEHRGYVFKDTHGVLNVFDCPSTPEGIKKFMNESL